MLSDEESAWMYQLHGHVPQDTVPCRYYNNFCPLADGTDGSTLSQYIDE